MEDADQEGPTRDNPSEGGSDMNDSSLHGYQGHAMDLHEQILEDAFDRFLDDSWMSLPSSDAGDYQYDSLKTFLQWWWRLRMGQDKFRHLSGAPLKYEIPPIGMNALRLQDFGWPLNVAQSDLTRCNQDMQGIDWAWLGTTKQIALGLRSRMILNRSLWASTMMNGLHSTHNFTQSHDYVFRSHRATFRPHKGWWQLSNNVTSSSNSCTFYASGSEVFRATTMTPVPRQVYTTATSLDLNLVDKIRALDSTTSLLAVGSQTGKIAFAPLSSPLPTSFTTLSLGSTINHVSLYTPRRSNSTHICISANASCGNVPSLYVIDTTVARIVHTHPIPWPETSFHGYNFPFDSPFNNATEPFPNVTATSQDARLRVVGGDNPTAILLDADSGAHLADLPPHQHDIFAAAWSPDGTHLATAGQDFRTQMYDARNLSAPIMVIPACMEGPRYLEFSPLGQGKPVLLCAEAQDVVSVIGVDGSVEGDRQDFEYIGATAGAGFVPQSRGDFVVGIQDDVVGGLMRFERDKGSLAWTMSAELSDDADGIDADNLLF